MSVQETRLREIADAIRAKEGSTEPIPANAFARRILALEMSRLPEGTHTINLQASDPEGGTVVGGGVASDGMTVTVNAEVENGYEFKGWQEDGETVNESKSYTFTVNGDRVLSAVFEVKPSRLPEGYQELEYIKVTARQNSNQYSLGGVGMIPSSRNRPDHPDDVVKVYLDYKLESIPSGDTYTYSNVTIYGDRTATSANKIVRNYYYGMYCSTGQLTFNYRHPGETAVTTKMPISADRTKLTVDLVSKVLTVNSQNYPIDITDTSAYLQVGTFACDYYAAGIRETTSHALVPGILYEVKAWSREGILISHGIPAKEVNTGTLGVYDIVNNFFNMAEANATAGPAV